ncbi:unnamed protein product [Ceratitis capitata]|uniref:(Mediterranean fruit fly) hypothetical protein n=1 Tax=Ceratitis capitata TaxID=7213 RepID=A0A811TXS7_CERCA|nr:unnamed protein product [Ceratitis capitata]
MGTAHKYFSSNIFTRTHTHTHTYLFNNTNFALLYMLTLTGTGTGTGSIVATASKLIFALPITTICSHVTHTCRYVCMLTYCYYPLLLFLVLFVYCSCIVLKAPPKFISSKTSLVLYRMLQSSHVCV